jgi:hypothetical protein
VYSVRAMALHVQVAVGRAFWRCRRWYGPTLIKGMKR